MKLADVHTWLALLGLMCACSATAAERLVLKYDAAVNDHKSSARMQYELELFRQFPRYTNANQTLELRPSYRDMSPARALQELAKGTNINILAIPARNDMPNSEIMIPIPIMKGLLGFRQLIVHQDALAPLKMVDSVKQLQNFTLGQGNGWAEVNLYKANNFTLIEGLDLSSLFNMVSQKRFDILPLGVVESDQEIVLRQYEQLAIVPEMLLYYPLPVTFYVHRNETALANFIQHAMEAMLMDGTLDALLDKHFRSALSVIRSPGKNVLTLDNPGIREEISLSRDAFWLRP